MSKMVGEYAWKDERFNAPLDMMKYRSSFERTLHRPEGVLHAYASVKRFGALLALAVNRVAKALGVTVTEVTPTLAV